MFNEKEGFKLMAKPIEATPVLRGQDLIRFVEALTKQDNPKAMQRRSSAASLLRIVKK